MTGSFLSVTVTKCARTVETNHRVRNRRISGTTGYVQGNEIILQPLHFVLSVLAWRFLS